MFLLCFQICENNSCKECKDDWVMLAVTESEDLNLRCGKGALWRWRDLECLQKCQNLSCIVHCNCAGKMCGFFAVLYCRANMWCFLRSSLNVRNGCVNVFCIVRKLSQGHVCDI